MIRSMTAFTRQEKMGEFGVLVLELRSVNHRYLDVSLRLPEEIRHLETDLRERVPRHLSRGKLDITLRYQQPDSVEGRLIIDKELAAQVGQVCHEIDKLLYSPAPVSALDVLRWPGVLQSQSVDHEQLKQAVLTLFDTGLQDLVDGREREGAKLKQMIEQRCDSIAQIVEAVNKLLPSIKQAWRDKLLARFEEAKLELDANRLEQEMVYLAQKTDVEEELDRITMHVAEVRRVLGENKPIGRRLDFLMQELNREANTLGSKSVHAETTKASVDFKVCIEQMREQIQNIE